MALAIYFDFSLLGPPGLRAGLGALVRWARWSPCGACVPSGGSSRILGAFVVVLAAWLAIPPSNARDWQPDVATLALPTSTAIM